MTKSRIIVGVAGRIGSGKSVVAHYLEQHFGFQYLRYSLVLSEWFRTEPEAKAQLQEVGWEVMSGQGQLELNRRLIAKVQSNRDCAIDGLRHPIDYDALRDQFRHQFFLIYVDTPPEIRFDRLRGRYSTYDQFCLADSHPVESNISSLISLSSAVVSGTVPLDELGTEIGRLVDHFRSGEAL